MVRKTKASTKSRHWDPSFWLLSLSLFIIPAVLLSFQNCAEPLNLSEEDAASLSDDIPFAFDTKLDTVAYMSCSDRSAGYSSRAFFTFRAGAYNEGSGIKLSEEFLKSTEFYTAAQRVAALSESQTNSGALLQLAIRNFGELRSVFPSGGSEEGVDYDNILAPLDTPSIAGVLASLEPGERVRGFRSTSGVTGKLVEGSLNFMQFNAVDENQLRLFLRDSGSHMMTLTYKDPLGQIAYPKSPERPGDGQSMKTAYGSAFQFYFEKGVNNNGTYETGERALGGVTEYDLLTGNASSLNNNYYWDCGPDYQFVIIKPEDPAGCQRQVDPLPSEMNSRNKRRLKAIRSVLRVEDWWVDLKSNCVVPKEGVGRCYKVNDSIAYVTSPPSTCASNSSAICDCGPNSDSGRPCAHYVSVCVRRPRNL